MITRKRLEELNKKGGNIFTIQNKQVIMINLIGIPIEYELQDLFETEKQAEWDLKYHATRTEELDLPMWEDVKNFRENEIITFYAKDMKYGKISMNVFENAFSVDSESQGELLYMNFTEENYIKACDLCLKLFNGEENGNKNKI